MSLENFLVKGYVRGYFLKTPYEKEKIVARTYGVQTRNQNVNINR